MDPYLFIISMVAEMKHGSYKYFCAAVFETLCISTLTSWRKLGQKWIYFVNFRKYFFSLFDSLLQRYGP